MKVEGKVRVHMAERIDHSSDLQWLREHRQEHLGDWVALAQGRLIASGYDAAEVYAAAMRFGVNRPLLVQVEPREALSFGGW